MLKKQNAPEHVAVRFVCEEQEIALWQDGERAGDTTFQREGRMVLLLDARVSELPAAHTLDLEDARLTLQLPGEGEQRRT